MSYDVYVPAGTCGDVLYLQVDFDDVSVGRIDDVPACRLCLFRRLKTSRIGLRSIAMP